MNDTLLREILTGIKNMQGDIKGMQGDIQGINTQLCEHGLILKALEHSSSVNKAEMDNLTHAVVRVEGEVVELRKDFSAIETITAKNWNDIAKLKSVK